MKSLLIPFLFSIISVNAQPTFTKGDTLRGMLSPARTCFDVNFYNLNVRVEPDKKYITGSNDIHYTILSDFDSLQIDLFANMKINKIEYEAKELPFRREFNAVFVKFPVTQKTGAKGVIKVFYEGAPIVAKNPPWDGGFVWKKDDNGNHFIGVACEGIGASLWWPNKDHLTDEPDSMRISCKVPSDLVAVSNGVFINKMKYRDGYTQYNWKVNAPINNYNVTLNIANYRTFHDVYISGKDTLDLDYYVLPYNLEIAKKHFEQVKPMLKCYEKYFGKYPFYEDGFALVETPYYGMEHQGSIAYGNGYRNDMINKYDYIIVHEAGHEWWGNNVTAADIAEVWIHESFCTYGESVFIECMESYDRAIKYLNNKKFLVANREPIIGPLNVNYDGWVGSDMYYKGALMLNTLRSVIANDSLWFDILYDIQHDFRYQVISSVQLFEYINKKAGQNFTYLFDQYLRYPNIPVFQYKIDMKDGCETLTYRWKADVKDFRMPLKVKTAKGWEVIYPTTEWKTMPVRAKDFAVNEDHYYIKVVEGK